MIRRRVLCYVYIIQLLPDHLTVLVIEAVSPKRSAGKDVPVDGESARPSPKLLPYNMYPDQW